VKVGVLRLELFLHAPLSLKEKRGVVQKLLGRCRSRFPVSCAETGLQDLWQRSEVGFVMVASDGELIRTIFARVEEEVERLGDVEICETESDFLDY